VTGTGEPGARLPQAPSIGTAKLMRFFNCAFLAAFAVLVSAGAQAQQPRPDPAATTEPQTPGAVLQGLDKVIARISTFEAPFDQVVTFGTLSIRVRACHKTPPTEPPESTAFLEIGETNAAADARPLFSGWMFASSPAVSALEHPVYDVWVVDCMKAASSASDSSG